jgi:hypothetical protein
MDVALAFTLAPMMMASLPPATAILLGTAASMPTVTVVLYLISNGLLPLDPFAR